jgi:Gametolysin peptidase M11
MFLEKSRTATITVCRLIMPVLAVLLSSAIAEAATVTIDEGGMNAVFSQPSFGDTPIGIRFNPVQEIVAPNLLIIDNLTELQALYALVPYPAPTVFAFFVDLIKVCTTVEEVEAGDWNGCAQLPGHALVLDSNSAELNPANLMAHELGHNLGLEHSGIGLMSYFPLFPRRIYSKTRSQRSCRARWSRQTQ